jgi:hypothetical protein
VNWLPGRDPALLQTQEGALMVSMNLVTHDGDGLLAAPQDRVLRVLAAIRLAEVFCVHASMEEAAGSARRSRPMALRVA